MMTGNGPAPRRRSAGALGFTYIEVLVAILIIGLVTPILIGGLIGSLTHARRSQDHGAAAAWLQGEIDYLRGQCYGGLSPSTRKVTPSALRDGEPLMPEGFAAALVQINAAGDARLKATVSLYRKDWAGAVPVGPPTLSTTTYIGDIRMAGSCP